MPLMGEPVLGPTRVPDDELRQICKPFVAAMHHDAELRQASAEALVGYARQMARKLQKHDEWEAIVEAWDEGEPERRQERLRYLETELQESEESRLRLLGFSMADCFDESVNESRRMPIPILPMSYAMASATDEEKVLCRQFGLFARGHHNTASAPERVAFLRELIKPPPEPKMSAGPVYRTNVPRTREDALIRLGMLESWFFPEDPITSRARSLVDPNSPDDWEISISIPFHDPRPGQPKRWLQDFFTPDAEDIAIEAELRRWYKLASGREFGGPQSVEPAAGAGGDKMPSKPAKSRSRKANSEDDTTTVIKAALLAHHGYADHLQTGEPLNDVPIGIRELSRKTFGTENKRSIISRFVKDQFENHSRYKAICHREKREGALSNSLKLMDGAYPPSLLYGRTPPGERDLRGDD